MRLILIGCAEQALLDHHAVAVISGEKVRGVLHFYQLAGPTAPVNIGTAA